jgi:hypothetical protein
MDLAFGKWNLIENSATTVGKDPFDADEEDRRDDEDDEQEQLERQERQDEEEDEDIYSDDMRGNFVRPALPFSADRLTDKWRSQKWDGARIAVGACANRLEKRTGQHRSEFFSGSFSH